ncbi:hypothetical protein V6N13_034898 [Hibiscus sabdariffa]
MVVIAAVRASVFGLRYPPSLASKQSKRCRMDGKNVSRAVSCEQFFLMCLAKEHWAFMIWRELASYLGPAMLAHLYMGLSELVMRGSEEKKNGKKE